MPSDLLVIVFGAATTALQLAFGVPQFLRVRRTGSVAGVSLPSISNNLISNTAWTLYGLALLDPWLTAMSAAALPAMTATFVVVVRGGVSRRGMGLPVAWAALLVSTAALTPWAPAVFPAVIGCSLLWYVGPAAVTAWRSRDVSGIAAGTWWLLVLDGALAAGYGVAAELPAAVIYAVVAVTGAAVVLLRLLVARLVARPETVAA